MDNLQIDKQEKIRKILGGSPKWANDTIITFGKYCNQSVGDIFEVDIGYLCWLEYQPWIKPELKKAIKLVLASK